MQHQEGCLQADFFYKSELTFICLSDFANNAFLIGDELTCVERGFFSEQYSILWYVYFSLYLYPIYYQLFVLTYGGVQVHFSFPFDRRAACAVRLRAGPAALREGHTPGHAALPRGLSAPRKLPHGPVE